MNKNKLRKLGCILVCILIMSTSISSACAASISKKDANNSIDNVNNITKVNNTTSIDENNIITNKTINKINATTNNTTKNNKTDKTDYDKIREKLLKELPENHALEYSNPITRKNGKLYFSRSHCLINTPEQEVNEAMGAIYCWLFWHKSMFSSEWKWSKDNIYNLLTPIIAEEDKSVFYHWLNDDYQYYKSNTYSIVVDDYADQFYHDVRRYNDDNVFVKYSPFESVSKEKIALRGDASYAIVREAVCQAVDWLMSHHADDELFTMESIRRMISKHLDVKDVEDKMMNYDFYWTADHDEFHYH